MYYLLLLLGIIIRLFLIPIPGFKADVAFWKGWGLAVADKGILWLVNNTNYNYPPGFAYVLWVINKVYALFKNPYNINEYWADNNIFYLFLIKLITIAADLLIVWLIIKILKVILGSKATPESNNDSGPHFAEASRGKRASLARMTANIGKILALFYFLNPAVIYDGVIWGQVDQLGLVLFLTSCYLLLISKPRWASVVFVVSCLMKFQNIIFIPLFFLYIFRRFWTPLRPSGYEGEASQNDVRAGVKELISSLAVAFLTFLIVVSPFIAGRQMEKLIWLLIINSDWFPWYSLNSFNIWWILSGLKGMQMNDKHLFTGIISAKQFGLYMFIFTYFISSITVLLSKKDELFRNFILACSLAVFAFFHLLTQSHERYLFPVMGLLPLVVILGIPMLHRGTPESNNDSGPNFAKATKGEQAGMTQLKIFFFLYFLISLFFFLNMYLSMGWNYPDQVIPAFSKAQTLGMSWWISVVQIILFAVFIIRYFKEIVRKNLMIVSLSAGLLVTLLIAKNVNYLLVKPISLTVLKPVGYHQDYLEPMNNKSVESARGVKYWNRLSVNYFYYDKGIGSHADSEITYHLGRKFSKFSSDYGIDTESDQKAKVYFSLVGDDKEIFKSGVKGRFDKPGTIAVDVKGVNYLKLKITKAGDTNFGAHADWLNPILIR